MEWPTSFLCVLKKVDLEMLTFSLGGEITLTSRHFVIGSTGSSDNVTSFSADKLLVSEWFQCWSLL